MTAADAARYLAAYEARDPRHRPRRGGARRLRGARHLDQALGAASALLPRAARARDAPELLPRLQALAALARSYDIGLNIDAEEADRLDLSLDLLEARLRGDPALAGWNGLGFVVQAYQKRAPSVVDWLIDARAPAPAGA